jgi:hypothetical protein
LHKEELKLLIEEKIAIEMENDINRGAIFIIAKLYVFNMQQYHV